MSMAQGAQVTAKAKATQPKVAHKRPARAVDVSSLLELHGPHARVILVIFVVAQGLLAFGGVDTEHIWAATISFTAYVVAAVWVVRPASDPFPAAWTAIVLVLCAVTVGAQVALHPLPESAPLYATWQLGGVTALLFMLIMRGRVLMGWIGYVVMAATTIWWGVDSGLGPDAGLELVIRHAATLLVGTAIYFGLRGTARRIAAVSRRDVAEASAEAAAHATEDERIAQLARLDESARPMLERVAEGTPLSEEEKRDCLLTEASLRDVVRGRGLAFAHVLSAARGARERGVDVTILDDSGVSWGSVSVADLLARELRTIDSGSVTARLQPPGRDVLASIVIAPDDAPARMLVIDLAGRVREGASSR